MRSKSDARDDLNDEKSARSFKQGRRKSSADAMKGRMFDMIFLGRNHISPSQKIEELSVASLEQKHKMRPPAQFVVKADIEDNERYEIFQSNCKQIAENGSFFKKMI